MTCLPQRLIEPVCAIAVDAARAILAVAAPDTGLATKGDGSPVTAADRASHDVIAAGLRALDSRLPIVSEEGDLPSLGGPAYWLVDPLDGTKEFVRGTPEYTVNIALIDDGVPVLGVIVIPGTMTCYWAAAGHGAWRRPPGVAATRIRGEGSPHPVTAAVSRSHAGAETEAALAAAGITRVVRCGSSLKICAVADGSADIYPRLGPTWYWDTAAGAAIAGEAGCAVVDLHGQELRYPPAPVLKHAGFVVFSPVTAAAAAADILRSAHEHPASLQ